MENKRLDSNRIDYLDIAKGILIITVVMCHSPFKFAYFFYWFHMPAFFIISGILFKENIDIKSQFKKFFIPYISYTLISILINFLTNSTSISLNNFLLYLGEHIFSGKAAPGVFWFIPCLFFTKIIFNFLKKHLNIKIVGVICALLYFMAHIYSKNIIPNEIVEITKESWVIWNIDVIPIALTYYFLGYVLKDALDFIKFKYTVYVSLIVCVIYCIVNIRFNIGYYLNLKYSYYKFFLLDLFVPIIFTILILAISYKICAKKGSLEKILSKLGKKSLIIMYLHNPLNEILYVFFNSGFIVFTLIGTVLPLFFSNAIEKYPKFKYIFEGVKLRKDKNRYSY